jgi:hypothetical protein
MRSSCRPLSSRKVGPNTLLCRRPPALPAVDATVIACFSLFLRWGGRREERASFLGPRRRKLTTAVHLAPLPADAGGMPSARPIALRRDALPPGLHRRCPPISPSTAPCQRGGWHRGHNPSSASPAFGVCLKGSTPEVFLGPPVAGSRRNSQREVGKQDGRAASSAPRREWQARPADESPRRETKRGRLARRRLKR